MQKKESPLSPTLVRFSLYLVLLLPLLFLREPTPTDEIKYFRIAAESSSQGSFWCTYDNGEMYTDKPPVYFWLIRLTRFIFGNDCYTAMSLFSLIPALLVLAVFNSWCRKELRGRYRRAAEITLFSTAYFFGAAVVLRMDMLMTLFITLAMWWFWKIYSGKHKKSDKYILGIFVFLAMFTKGPVGLLMPIVCTAVYLAIKGNFKAFKHIWDRKTWAPILIGCLIWWTMTAMEGGFAYLKDMLLHQTFGRAFNSFAHSRDIFYYLYSIWYIMGPWSLITIGLIIWALVKKKIELPSLANFFIISAGTFILMMSLFSCKLQIYLLPCMGFINYAAYMILYKMALTNHEMHVASKILRKTMVIGSAAILVLVFVISIGATDWMNRTLLSL